MKNIFIIPYRDREPQKEIFLNQMEKLLVNEKDYEIIICHQCDKRKFNRGGVKNIGFLYAKEKYSNWKDITFIFHDIDYLPYKKIFDYETTHGTVTHFYGFDFAFGGIWAIKGKDFEIKINDKKYDFLKDINPTGGVESTGVVTRFTIDHVSNNTNFPIRSKLFSISDLIIILTDSYLNDIKNKENEN